MPLVLKDRVKETSTTTGTGTLTLAGAAAGFQSFSVIGDGNTTYYAIVDSAAGTWEVGIGTYTASGTTLSRDTVLESSNSGSLVNFGAGPKDVFVTYPAEKSVYLDAVNAAIAPEFKATSTGANTMPVGTTAQRPASPQAGMYRLNSTTGEPEWYDVSAGQWKSFREEPGVAVDFLVIAGGGGGSYGGGGGAGGYREFTSQSLAVGTAYTVTVGAGGAQAVSGVGNNGSNSVFSTITSAGGGYGRYNTGPGLSAGSGGSGGGAGGANDMTAGAGNTPATSPSQGNNGGTGSTVGGGGGGGASAVGGNVVSTTGGAGGAGTASSITGSSVTRAGGGGGGAGGAGGAAGAGGGGAGSTTTGANGTANTGGGGGGGWNNSGGNGGSGVVIVKYPDTYTITNPGGGLTFTTASSGGFKVTTFTAGTGSIQFN